MKKGAFLIVAASAMWGSVSIFLTLLADSGISRIQIIWLRSWSAALLLFAICALRNSRQLHVRAGDWWIFAGNGVIAMSLFSLCYWKAMSMVGVAVSAILIYTAPIFSLPLSRLLFGERISRRCLIALCLSIVGIALVSDIGSGTNSISIFGIFYGLLGGFFYATQAIFGKLAVARHYSSITVTAWSTLASGIVLTLPALLGGLPVTLFSTLRYPLILVAMSIVCTVIPCNLFITGLESISPGRASMLTACEPCVALLIGCLFFRETLKPISLAGILLIIASVFIITSEQQRPDK